MTANTRGKEFPEPPLANAAAFTEKQKMKLCQAFLQESKGDPKKTALIQSILTEEKNQEDDALCHMRKAAEDAQTRVKVVDAALKLLIDAFHKAGAHKSDETGAPELASEWEEAGVPELEHTRAFLAQKVTMAQNAAQSLSLVNRVLHGRAVSMNEELKKKVNDVQNQVRDILCLHIASNCTDPKSRTSFMQVASEALGEDLRFNNDLNAQLMQAVKKVLFDECTGESIVFASNNKIAKDRRGGPRPPKPSRQKKESLAKGRIPRNRSDCEPQSSCTAMDPNWLLTNYPHATDLRCADGCYSYFSGSSLFFASNAQANSYDFFYGPEFLQADRDEEFQKTSNTRVQQPIGASAPRLERSHTATERSIEDTKHEFCQWYGEHKGTQPIMQCQSSWTTTQVTS